MMIEPETAFWEFSLEIYALPGVAEAALRLQDQHGKDVNLTLYCLYAGLVLGRRFDEVTLAALEAAVTPWTKAVIDPLRDARRGSKTFEDKAEASAFRHRLQMLELDAEKLAQRRLVAVGLTGEAVTGSIDLARDNLLLYVGDLGQNLIAVLREAF